jgi:aspartyl protease family protein
MATGFIIRYPYVKFKLANVTAVLLGLLVVPTIWAAEVSVIALFPDKAVLVVDQGKPKTVKKGQTYNGVTLLFADTEVAVIQVDGKTRRLKIGEGVYSGKPTQNARASVTLTPDGSGHFITMGSINGASVRFLLDTGATLVSMSVDDAKRAGINYLAGERGYSQTANGLAPVYKVRLAEVRLGDITLHDIEGLVHAGSALPVVLLGMSFLGRLEMRREGDSMTLTKRF